MDDMGALIEKLLIAQNQTLSKLSQLIHILQRMVNATDAGKVIFYGKSQNPVSEVLTNMEKNYLFKIQSMGTNPSLRTRCCSRVCSHKVKVTLTGHQLEA